jgi:membrane protease YdiL (CAAX protease family)
MHEQMTGALPEGAPAQGEARGPGWGWGDLLLALGVTVVGGAALALGARALVRLLGLTVEQRLISPALYLVGLGVYLSAVLGVYLFAARKAGWAALGLRRARSWRDFAIVPPLFVVGLTLVALVNAGVGLLAGGFENPQVDALTGGRTLAPGELLALLALVAGVVPFAEELFFRGMLYPLLRSRLAAALAIVLNAALFAAAHVVPLLLPGLFVVGLLLAYLRERSGSIWPSVCFHALQNGTALLLINAALAAGAI